jgi:SAM-dependent methyltransferase
MPALSWFDISHVMSTRFALAATATSLPSQAVYVCPHCKGPLEALTCQACRLKYPAIEGIPCFLGGAKVAERERVREVYDEIYSNHEDVWTDQGRSSAFHGFFSNLVGHLSHAWLLEVGCGEGQLLAALPGVHKFGVDPSISALLRAKARSNATFAVALGEDLPFPSGAFDAVVAVGVMEHFANPAAALGEIRRVLKDCGYYLALIHTDLTRGARLALKFKEFFLPPRPLALLAWAKKKIWHPIRQPLRKSYTVDSARQLLESAQLRVTDIITRATHPQAPLAGSHVVILIAQKRASK